MIEFLPFDTQLFDYPVGSIHWRPDFTEERFIESSKDFKLVYIFSDSPISFSNRGIRHVDTKVTFEKELKATSPQESIRGPLAKGFDEFSPEELETLRFLALESGLYSRFKQDPRLIHDEFERLYYLWIKQAILSGNLLLGENLEGMITFSQKNEMGRIGLVAVHPNHRQQGWGKKLILASEHVLFDQGVKTLQIPTQEANLPAMRLYKNLGYRIVEKSYVYHFWRGLS
ncbi:Ribosomal protein S18 acetylase RimI [Algoriphagus faecimaris]|uniref:Ribosomal protein S18 acetylase RimI n=1 Tax=Algoriphagus faecimaris TaxID=686796 RepID=A0A1G6PTY1_9BACT|nr:GNAT family N-acetyltransferase [Algoriphagus faecimaris]SDC83431.1 Ribosomal protein S18 acetylase RimI [Algoriphagus faecimaris]